MLLPVLCVDLDGTLIYEDTLNQAMLCFIRKNPLRLALLLIWLLYGRAYLKKKIFQRVTLDPAQFSYNQNLIAWIKSEKEQGRKIILVTATDMKMARAVFEYCPLFDDVLASDGLVNLRSENKAAALNKNYGHRQYDYAGNSSADYPVWAQAREAIVVNASQKVLNKAKMIASVSRVYD
jgi:phosphoserine phosphatase